MVIVIGYTHVLIFPLVGAPSSMTSRDTALSYTQITRPDATSSSDATPQATRRLKPLLQGTP
jgi:hypothetical protein